MKNLPLMLAAATAAAASFSIAAASDEAEYRRATREELRLLEAGHFAPEIPEAAGSIMRSLDNGTSGESLRESSSLEFRKEKESGASQKGKEKERRHGSAGGSFVSGKYRAALSLAVLRLLILRKSALHLITLFGASFIAGLAISTARRTSFIPPRPGARFIAGITLAMSFALLSALLVRPHAETPSELILSSAALLIAAGLSASAQLRTESV